MGFFKKISEALFGDKKSDGREKRRAPRLMLDLQDRININLLHPEAKDKAITIPARVINISLGGLGVEFEDERGSKRFQMGKKFLAALMVDDLSIPLQIKVVQHKKGKKMGIKFLAPYPKELKTLEQFLEPRFLGISMREINPENLKQNQGSFFRWFQGGNATDLFSWESKESNKIVHQQLVFLNNIVEWESDSSLKTGRIQEDSDRMAGHLGWVRAEQVSLDGKPDPKVLKKAQTILQATQIDSKTKETFLDHLRAA